MEFNVRSQKGDASEELEVLEGSEIKGEVKLQLNPLLLQQALEKFTDEKVSIRIYSEVSPILIFDKENYMSLVMPKRNR